MDSRREFFAKLVASGVGILPALKQSVPESEVHKLDKDAVYVVVLPQDFCVDQLLEIQMYMDRIPDLPKFLLMPFGEIQLYKL